MRRSPAIAAASYQGSLKPHLGFWVRFVSNRISGDFRLKLARHGISVAEWAFKRELAEHGAITPSRLAVHLSMTCGGVTKNGPMDD